MRRAGEGILLECWSAPGSIGSGLRRIAKTLLLVPNALWESLRILRVFEFSECHLIEYRKGKLFMGSLRGC